VSMERDWISLAGFTSGYSGVLLSIDERSIGAEEYPAVTPGAPGGAAWADVRASGMPAVRLPPGLASVPAAA
jgi:hypothetical protein